MSKFDTPPPYRSEKVLLPEWSELGEIEISELEGPAAQELIDLVRSNTTEGKNSEDLEYLANIIALCLTVGGEKPPLEWCRQIRFGTRRQLGDIALRINGMSQEAQKETEKN